MRKSGYDLMTSSGMPENSGTFPFRFRLLYSSGYMGIVLEADLGTHDESVAV